MTWSAENARFGAVAPCSRVRHANVGFQVREDRLLFGGRIVCRVNRVANFPRFRARRNIGNPDLGQVFHLLDNEVCAAQCLGFFGCLERDVVLDEVHGREDIATRRNNKRRIRPAGR